MLLSIKRSPCPPKHGSKQPEMLSTRKTTPAPETMQRRCSTMRATTTTRTSISSYIVRTLTSKNSNVFLGLALLELGEHEKSEQVTNYAPMFAQNLIGGARHIREPSTTIQRRRLDGRCVAVELSVIVLTMSRV